MEINRMLKQKLFIIAILFELFPYIIFTKTNAITVFPPIISEEVDNNIKMWLPDIIKSKVEDNIRTYTSYTIVDSTNNKKIIEQQAKSENAKYDADTAIETGKMIGATLAISVKIEGNKKEYSLSADRLTCSVRQAYAYMLKF